MYFENEYFDEEERDGFVIAPMMKRAWAAQLEVFDVIREVCIKNDINYYACGGTLLGAIRHKGFIPWDDDMDICMIRNDYMRFIEIAPKELPEGFVLAGMYANNKRLWLANQTMQARVIADEEFFPLPKYMNRFHGYPYPRIGIDIFPYEMLDEDYETIYHHHRIYFDGHYLMRNWYELKKLGSLNKLVREFEKNTQTVIDRSDEDMIRKQIAMIADGYASSASRDTAKTVSNITGFTHPNGFPPIKDYTEYVKHTLPIEWYGDGVDLPYENTKMRVGSDYIKIVEAIFGKEYMTPVKFSALHEYPFYKIQEAEFRRMLDESGVNVSNEEFCRNWHLANGGH